MLHNNRNQSIYHVHDKILFLTLYILLVRVNPLPSRETIGNDALVYCRSSYLTTSVLQCCSDSAQTLSIGP